MGYKTSKGKKYWCNHASSGQVRSYDFDVLDKHLKLGWFYDSYFVCQVCRCRFLDTNIVDVLNKI